MRYLYLHGFASGPSSRKAQAFRHAFEQRGIELSIPELDRGDFEHLTITDQLNLINNLLAGEPARLIGSSMGGYLAALYASTHPEADRLVLLAPAFDFAARWEVLTGPERLAHWRATGWLEVFHYADQTLRRVHFGLLEDARQYPASPDFHRPARIFHGTRDEVVPIGLSRAFAASHPNAELTEIDSDHELLNALDAIVAAAVPFLIA
ncbi:MAG: YqiA/YcfP family alpha/beta fold hydrolase [Bryobacteraceae bacterium]|jgi:pimeloyl-ACP methyl ester carboxylesterase